MLNEMRKRMKIIKTCNLYLSTFTLGLSSSLSGPCLLDLQHMVHANSEHIALIYTAKSIGYLVGAIIVGILLDLVRYKTSVIMVCTFLVASTMFAIPWSRDVHTLMAYMCVNGFTSGAIETGVNVLCLQLWGKDSNPIFQGLWFTYGLGSFIGPLIATPFLENTKGSFINTNNETKLEGQSIGFRSNFSNDVTTFSNNVTYFQNNVTYFSDISNGIPKIIYPFTMVGSFALLVGIVQLVVCFISPTEDRKFKDADKKDNSDRSLLFMFFTAFFTFLVFFFVVGSQVGYAQTLTIYVVKGKLHLSTRIGSYMTSAFWAAVTVARLLSVFISMKISSLKLIISDVCFMATASLILLFFMLNDWALWLASVLFGAGNASVYAAIIGWMNNHIIITNKFSAIFSVGSAAGEMVVPFIITYFIDGVPEMFTYVTTAAIVLMTVFLLLLYCMFSEGSKVKERKDIKCYVIDLHATKK